MQVSEQEKLIIEIVRKLPEEKLSEIIDFALFLQSRQKSELSGDRKWDNLTKSPAGKNMMRKMAKEAMEEYEQGKTTEIGISKEGKLFPL